MKKSQHKYFGIIQCARYVKNMSYVEWFIHFTFISTYQGEDDCSQHDDDYWESFWKLPNVKYDKICEGHFASPSAWNYIRFADEVDISDLYLGKWMARSPFHRNGKWQSEKES
jgi:hypothetical protein